MGDFYTDIKLREKKSQKQDELWNSYRANEITYDEYLYAIGKTPYTIEDKLSDGYDELKTGKLSLTDYMARLMSSPVSSEKKSQYLNSTYVDTLRKALQSADIDSILSDLSNKYNYNFSVNQDLYGENKVEVSPVSRVGSKYSGLYFPEDKNISLQETLSPYQMFSTLLHEYTHGVDDSVRSPAQDTIPYIKRPKEILANEMAKYFIKLFNTPGNNRE